ncbi:SGNH/GDSL hydrolase family protein [Mycolicibacterium sp. 018/SC-01/001]|uniref:SGNH/GDSL hydrolase family protein n=1 Tax=Mycolicibacterium sp. 018/SC-01/001 TaxID=2592069 RepID=UPI00163D9534|nr:SGNH/GDSL hydrolase family protein [Mycolicibacterium sp. 018/SC-01/001]
MRRTVVALCCFVAVMLTGCTRTPPAYESKYAPPTAEDPGIPVAIIGDSYTGGTPVGGRGGKSWPQVVKRTLDSEGVSINPIVEFEGGSGYVSRRDVNGRVFIDQVARIVNPAVKAVVIFGSRNDVNIPGPELARWVQRTMDLAVKKAPGVPLIIIGPPWVDANPPAGVLQARDIVRAGAIAHQAVWVDPIADGWFVGRPDLNGDGIQPNDGGHAYMAERIAPVLASALRPKPVS